MIRITDILDKTLSFLTDEEREDIKKAYVYAASVHRGQLRFSGEPYLSHPLAVADILADMKMDRASIVAGLLHDTVEDTHATIEDIQKDFGKDVAFLVEGLTKISRISFRNEEQHQAENFRKMILAMSTDIRILLVRLADRVHNMKTLEFHKSEEKRRQIAAETVEIYAPLANRLGIYWMKVELEDTAFRYLHPIAYESLADKISLRMKERESFIANVKGLLAQEMRQEGFSAEISGRAKHLFSIYSKMEKQRISFEEVYDFIAFRIILENDKEPRCYEALSYIHARWKPVHGRFKDYIAVPKANGYRSLHTTVIGPMGERIEIQIRTREMHEWAEKGIAAHWRYKEGEEQDSGNKQIERIRELLEMQQDADSPREYMSQLKGALFSDEVYVFTPQGDVKELPAGVTPIDFAYAVHTSVGNQCVGARVNGKMVPLRHELQNGDTVEIITQAGHRPSRDWLKFVVSSRAKAKIKAWIKEEDKKRTSEMGKEMLEKDLQKSHARLSSLLKSEKLLEILKELSLSEVEGLYTLIGKGQVSPKYITNRFLQGNKQEAVGDAAELLKPRRKRKSPDGVKGVSISGIDNMLVKFAKCCDPIPGDKIIGYISRGRGIIVHAHNCHYIANVDEDRLRELSWGNNTKDFYTVLMRVVCRDRKGVLADVSNAISSQDANISHAAVDTKNPNLEAVCDFKVDVHDLEHYQRIVNAIQRLSGVLHVERLRIK